MNDYARRTTFYTAFVDDPVYACVLDQVEGARGIYVFDMGFGTWMVCCHSVTRDPWDFERDCQRAIVDARRVSWLLEGVELGEW